jgi:hypothetical protein
MTSTAITPARTPIPIDPIRIQRIARHPVIFLLSGAIQLLLSLRLKELLRAAFADAQQSSMFQCDVYNIASRGSHSSKYKSVCLIPDSMG